DKSIRTVKSISNNVLEVEVYYSSFNILYYRLPTFAFIFAKLSEKKLEYMMLGDCVMLVNEMEITDHRVDNLFEKGKNEIKDPIGTNSVLNKKIILQKIRKLSNQPSGYWIGSLDERFLDHAIINQIDVTSEQIVLMSDGFYEFYQNNQNKTFEELIKMRFNSSAIDPIYGKKDDASIVVIDV
ncbi:protein phosphatase 2C family protein, partial [Streptococcus pneumoniae]|nr:protein phosphatase 2C family protein [Streptococcus pneumoniae]MDG8421744.1 protein phosphatase 2C family protein [Streptococcus pneumoniae]MDV8226024.1 protein phosphatase 2C family protein [Streptococcus pneumoniae]MDV8747387.1 protein phosphatase 2C family protein [Streptococcus pneumoniae]